MRVWALLVAAVAATLLWAAGAHAADRFERPGRTPVAKPGTPLASTRALSLRELRDEVEAALRSAGGRSGAWVGEVGGSGNELVDVGGSRRLIPASNQKLFTTAAFLAEFGAEGRLETRVFARGRVGEGGGSVLRGDLVLVGDGDPTFGTARFGRANDQPVTRVAALAREIAAAGVRAIRGRILVDDTIFDRKRRSGPYLSPLSGLSFNNGYDGGEYARAPELVAGAGLRNALRKRGVRVRGRIGRADLGKAALRRDPLAAVSSPTAARLIEATNVPSHNFFAEMLLKRVGAANGKVGTRKRGAKRVEAFARTLGSEVRVSDGSGLSRKNRVAPEEVGDLLVGMATRSEDAEAFRDSLPIAGREGTLAYRMRGTAAEGNCAAKTGTLSDVSALSGYCEAGGRLLAFSVINNDVSVSAARRAQDRIAAAVARYRP